ncbi:PTS lactose transporter subunit IIBC [Collinsella sp. AF23-2]|uniref:PTS lactose transporter subunit IIBC n=1 Tax=unclassified Collinsella TaxID=2637548 RepID=UPI000E556691|nr:MULTISPECIES: PTS lactose transporter subunit IIBC [unclassified Collinsella]RGS26156.1 PTS lactose transporter subunit IIBC [Collinsella sp. AF23-3LB]RGS27547.1 PTS lactose transporter subunit IIBC [Collinsella sp. AF23-2]
MDAIVKMLEKHQPFFEKISRNIYLQAIKDGFLGCMPIVLTSSIFLLIATLPGVVGITLPQPLIDWCNKLYNFTMGVMGIMVAGTTAKNFTASMNRRMPAGKVLNDGSTMVAAQCSMLLLAVTQFTTKFNGSELSVFDCTSMGTRGLFSAYIAAFITVWVYKFCVSRDLTIKLPKEVPGAIAQNFRDIIPFGGAVIICGIIDVVVRNLMGVPFSELLIKLLSPLFTAAETYPGLILIQAATAFFWFIGVHGPSIVQPGIDPIRLANQAENLQVLLAGGHPAHSLTFNMSLVGEFGGTGATFIVPLLLILFMKSKQLKAVGKASIVPVAFAVNEPLLFGAPMILNPYMLIPFVAAGCVNVSVAKFFIDNVGMNGFSFVVPWATPAPIGIFITTNFQLIALVFVAIIILLDAIIYLPFLKAYDKLLCDQEAERAAELGLESDGTATIAASTSAPAVEQATAAVEPTAAAADSKPVADQPEPAADASAKKDVDGLKVLVLCAGAGTSAMLANAIKEGAAQTGENIASSAGAYGQHTAIMDQYDVIVLAPQVRSYYNDMKADTDRLGIKLLAPRGKEYIDLTRDPAGAIKWLRENLD